MLQRDRHIRTQVQQLTDACVFAVSFWLAFVVRADPELTYLVNHTVGGWFKFFHWEKVSDGAFDRVMWLYFALVPAAPLVLESQGFYNRAIIGSRGPMFWPLLKGCFVLCIGLVLVLFLFRQLNIIPRGVIVCFGILSFFMVWVKEELLRVTLKSRMAKSQYKRNVIIAAAGSEIARLRSMIQRASAESIVIVDEFNLAETPVTQLIEKLHDHSVAGVVLSTRHTQLEKVESAIHICEIEGVEAWLIADFFTTHVARASLDEMFNQPLIVFRSTPETSWQVMAKLAMDAIGSTLLIILTAPIMLACAALVKFTSPGPVFFRQQRSGLNGAPFTILKFRTMMTNAEQMKHELAAMNEMTGPVFKVTNDPRITPVGKFLRKWSLDELPQLFNVIRGEMSLVGPRPLPVDEVKRFNDVAHRRRLSVKPGLTCLWQVGGRNKISDFKEWVRLDLEYIDNWSIWLDIVILFRTIPAVFLGSGAK